MKTERCMKCDTEIWGNRIFEIKVCDCEKGKSVLCPECVKEYAIDMLGKVWLVEHMTGTPEPSHTGEIKLTDEEENGERG